MADNTELNTGTGGDVVRDLARQTAPGVAGTVKTQTVQLDVGGDSTNAENLVSGANPLPTSEKNANIDTPLAVSVVGDSTGDFAGQAILEQVMDDNSGLYFNVKTVNKPPLTDAKGALVASDAAGPFFLTALNSTTGSTNVIDTTGYNSLSLRTYTTGGSTPQFSNDGFNWFSATGWLAAGGSAAPVTSVNASSDYVFQITGRYFRLTSLSTSAIPVLVYLRTAQVNWMGTSSGVSLAQIGGNTVATTGNTAAGMLAVGGPSAAIPGAAATTANTGAPVSIAGADSTPTGALVRRILTDPAGSISMVPGIVANPNAATTVPLAPMAVAQSPLDPAGVDGVIGALTKVVQYLASIDFLLRELPLNLTNAMNSCVLTKSSSVGVGGDVNDFYEFRDDPTNFNS